MARFGGHAVGKDKAGTREAVCMVLGGEDTQVGKAPQKPLVPTESQKKREDVFWRPNRY